MGRSRKAASTAVNSTHDPTQDQVHVLSSNLALKQAVLWLVCRALTSLTGADVTLCPDGTDGSGFFIHILLPSTQT